MFTLVSLPGSAHASLLSFDVLNHPNGQYGKNVNKADKKDYVLLLKINDVVNTFRSVDVQMVVDTATGRAQMFGNIIHLQSGDPWRLDIALDAKSPFGDAIGSRGPWDGPGDNVPYADMFKDLKAAGCSNAACTGRANEIFWGNPGIGVKTNDLKMKLTYTGAGSPSYGGKTAWVGIGDQTYGEGGFVTYRHRLSQTVFGSAYYDPQFCGADPTNKCIDATQLFGGDFFWSPKGENWWNRGLNSLFLLRPRQVPPPVIPEPATGLLFGLGAFGAQYATRRRKCSTTTGGATCA